MSVQVENALSVVAGDKVSIASAATDLAFLHARIRELEGKQRDLEWLINSVDGIVWEGVPGTLQFSFVSRQAERLLGYPVERWYEPAFWADHLHPDDAEWAMEFCTKEVIAGRPHDFEYRMIAADGRVVWLRDIVSLTTDTPPVVHGIMVDITARKESEAELRASYQQVQQLAASLIHAKEAERSRIARELHDSISQQLATASIGLSVLTQQLTARQQSEARRLSSTLEQAIEAVRTLSHELHPAVLRHSGLIAALTSHCKEFRVRYGTKLTVDVAELEEVRGESAVALFRIVQEALHNVAKHANARSVRITLKRADSAIELSIEDDGKGFDPDRPWRTDGLGLISIEERVRLLGGTIDLRSGPGTGTRLNVRMPLTTSPSAQLRD
jgi:PAS domain S-box-containing protein